MVIDILNANLLEKCLDHAHYDNARDILDAYVNRSDIMISVDEKLGLGADLRRWIEVDIPEDKNEIYADFKRIMGNDAQDVEYKNWISGKMDDGRKLGKTILKRCSADNRKYIEELLTQRVTKTWLCISRNILDYIFVSTNQSFTSCLDLESECSEAYYLGLFALASDESRFLIFTTKSIMPSGSYWLVGENVNHYRYINRSWCLVGKNDKFVITEYYPQKTISCRDKIEANTKLRLKKEGEYFQSIGKTEVAVIYDNNHFIYIDGYTGLDTCTGTYCGNGDTECVFKNDINYTYGFDRIGNVYDIIIERETCIHCEERFDRDDINYIDDVCICEDCLSNYYTYCEDCNECYPNDEITRTKYGYVCDYCRDNNYTQCDHCDTYVKSDEITIAYDKSDVCERCRDRYFTKCDECEEYYYDNDVNDEGICENCEKANEAA